MRDIGKNLREARVRRGLTQDELAERLHVSRQTVSNYETGRSRPDVEMLLLAAEQLEADVQELLYGPSLRPERRRELRGLAAWCGVLAVFGGVLLWLEGVLRRFQGRFFVLGPSCLMMILAVPAFWFLAGWLALRACGAFLGARPCRRGRILRRAVLACLAAWAALELPMAVEAARQILEVLGGEAYGGGFRLPALWERGAAYGMYWLGGEFPAVFALLGGGLWLSGGKERPAEERGE